MKKYITIAVLMAAISFPFATHADTCINANSADVNSDGVINSQDLTIISQNYNQPGDYAHGDLNGDGQVNFSDLLLYAQNVNKTLCAPIETQSFSTSGGFAPEMAVAGQYKVGDIICSQWATTCMVIHPEGYSIIPNPNYQNGN